MSEQKLTLTLDFDGVLHSYKSGWKGADVIPDPPVPGAIEFVREAVKHFKVWICSSRCVGDSQNLIFPDGAYAVTASINMPGIVAMRAWLMAHGLAAEDLARVGFSAVKPPSHVMIDDRAMRFTGEWFDGEPSFKEMCETIKAFQPWNHHLRHPK